MAHWISFQYSYDGTFAGFLTCVYWSYVNKEKIEDFAGPRQSQSSLFPQRPIATHRPYAQRVYRSLAEKLSPQGQDMVRRGFLTSMEDKERKLYDFIRLGYRMGPQVTKALADPRVAAVAEGLTHLKGEVHLLKGFVRFSDYGELLAAEIEPKNWVLPLLAPHFTQRYPEESFLIHDKTHGQALFYRPYHAQILPISDLKLPKAPSEEAYYRALWRKFYDTVAIEGRYNPKLRMTHMPKRYWGNMTEFQGVP